MACVHPPASPAHAQSGEAFAAPRHTPVSGQAPSRGCAYRLLSSESVLLLLLPSSLLALPAPAGGIGAWSAWHACCAELAARSGSSGTNMCFESAAGRARTGLGLGVEEDSRLRRQHGATHRAGYGDTSFRSRAELWAVGSPSTACVMFSQLQPLHTAAAQERGWLVSATKKALPSTARVMFSQFHRIFFMRSGVTSRGLWEASKYAWKHKVEAVPGWEFAQFGTQLTTASRLTD